MIRKMLNTFGMVLHGYLFKLTGYRLTRVNVQYKPEVVPLRLHEMATQLRVVRLEHKMTLAQASSDIGISVSYLSGIERGKVVPTIRTLEKIASFYNLDVRVSLVERRNDG